MIKLYSGEGKGRAWQEMGCPAGYNWDWPAKLARGAEGLDVWPLVQLVSGSTDRLVAWCREHPASHIMIENEPLTQKGLSVSQAGRRIGEELLPVVAHYCPSARRVLFGHLIEQPMSYVSVRSQAYELASLVGHEEGDVMAFHLYLHESPSLDEVPDAAAWFARQVEGIATDWPMFAITEWGALRTSYSGRDVTALSEYMRRCWDALLKYQCYASAWYLAAPNSQVSAFSDFVLCWENGMLKPLGMAYMSLESPAPVDPDPGGVTPQAWEVHNVSSWFHDGREWESTVRSRPI